MPYKKCPRCNLNYIKDTEVLCKVCLEEVGKNINDFDKDEEYDICPECGENIIKAGEDMCYQCMVEQIGEDVDEEDLKSDVWDDVLSDEESELFDDKADGEVESIEDLETLEDIESLELDEEFDDDEIDE
jgi:hypothetical protein